MAYAIFLITVGVSFTVGYVAGYFIKVSKMNGDICIACDDVEGVKYPFLRLNGSLDDISEKEFVSFRVVKQTRGKNSL